MEYTLLCPISLGVKAMFLVKLAYWIPFSYSKWGVEVGRQGYNNQYLLYNNIVKKG